MVTSLQHDAKDFENLRLWILMMFRGCSTEYLSFDGGNFNSHKSDYSWTDLLTISK